MDFKWLALLSFVVYKNLLESEKIIGVVQCSDETVKYQLPPEYKQTQSQCLFTNLSRVFKGFMTTVNYISSWTLLY